MQLRYKVGFGVFMIVMSVFILGTSLLVGFSLNSITGVILLLLGMGYLTRPLAELNDDQLTILALIGPVKKQFRTAELHMADGKVFASEKKVPLARWLVNKDDWRKLEQWLGRVNQD